VEAEMHACDMPEGGRGWWMLTATWDTPPPKARERESVSQKHRLFSLSLSLPLGLDGWTRRLGGWLAGWRAMRFEDAMAMRRELWSSRLGPRRVFRSLLGAVRTLRRETERQTPSEGSVPS